MSDTKAKAINIFTCDENRKYLHSVIPVKIDDERLQSILNAFSRNYDSYISKYYEIFNDKTTNYLENDMKNRMLKIGKVLDIKLNFY